MTTPCCVPKKRKANRIARIPLARPKAAKASPSEMHKHKSCICPTDDDSPQCELTAPCFSTGAAEERSPFCKNLKKTSAGFNLTTGAARFELACNLLTGDALSIFDTAAADANPVTSETKDLFEVCLDTAAHAAFPA